MGEIAKRAVLVIAAVVAVVAVVAGLLVWQPWTTKAPAQSGGVEQAPSATATATGGQARSDSGLVVRAGFPSATGLGADIKLTQPTAEMLASAPASFRNLGTADFTVIGGDFPDSGAVITVDLPQPAAQDRGIMIAHWNEQQHEWEPVATELSADRRHASAKVSHFSPYGFWDYAFNKVNQALGNAASSGVECDAPMPGWVDPQYFDDMNGPIRWCGGKDAKNADVLVAKLKMNRASAASISTAIKPAWVWSDLWQSMGPETMLQMTTTATMQSPAKLGDVYIAQPFGEYNFGFSRAALEKFYADGRWDKPLIDVSIGWQYTLFGVIYEELKDKAEGNIAGAVAMLALGQCSSDLATATSSQSAAEKASFVMGCIGSSVAAVEKGALTFVTKKIPGTDSARAQKILKPVLSSLRMVTGAYTKVSSLMKVFTTIGDMTLPANTRQFLYQPSVAAIKETAAKKKSASTATKFVTMDPWSDGSLAAVTATSEGAGRSCSGSEIAPRSDAFRCSAGDPCFQSPTTKTDFLCFFWRYGDKKVSLLKGASLDSGFGPAYINPGTPASSSIVMAELADGTVCARSTGAGPQGVPGYPYWAGACTGPSAGVWRVGDPDKWKTDLSRYPLYPPKKVGGAFQVAISIGDETAPATLVDVKTAYR